MRNLVHVIVVSWNGRKLLKGCLDSLRGQVYKPIVVTMVDNDSEDDSIDFVASNYPEVNIIALTRNVGFSKANNIAINTVESDFVALLNQDAIAHPFWLERLTNALRTCPAAGFAASKMLLYDNQDLIDRAGDAYSKVGAGLLRGRGISAENYNEEEMIFGACGGAVLYRADMLKDVGVFDEDFFLLYEDVDLSFRAQLRGYKCLYVPEAVVYHKASSSIMHDSATSIYYSHRNLEWVYIKNMPGRLIGRTILSHLAYNIGAFLFFLVHKRGLTFLSAKIDALRGLRRALKKRRKIQMQKTVEDFYIWRLLERELFIPRLKTRLQRK